MSDHQISSADLATSETKFRVRSLPDGTGFQVSRHALEACEVFKDMFACCDHGFELVNDSDEDRPGFQEAVLDLDETGHALAMLFRLIQHPPAPPRVEISEGTRPRIKPDADSVIPFPILPFMLSLADKYGVSETVIRSLHLHMQCNAARHPLPVYAYATKHGLPMIAAEASAHLLHPPLSSYTKEDVEIIPSVTAYHDLLRLHEYRKSRLREILLKEDLFPHGYGSCTMHRQWVTQLWEQKRMHLAAHVEAATDIAGEMRELIDQCSSCSVCHKAMTAAVEMIQYKCQKVARTVDYVPQDY